MTRKTYVSFSRYFLSFLASFILLLPLSFILITLVNHWLLEFPTVHLIIITASIVVIGFLLSLIAPIIRNLMIKNIFPGSYDYDKKLKILARQLAQNPHIDDRILFCTDSLAKIIGVKQVHFGAYKKNQFNIAVLSRLGLKNWLSFGPKINHDPWTKNDRRRLKWFSSSVAVTLNLEQQRRLEKRRLAQIKKKVLISTQRLKKLNRDLIQRDKDLALQFDELAHDLKNPIAITLNILSEVATSDLAKKDATKQQSLKNLLAEAAWMDKSTSHLLDLARAEAGKTRSNKKPLNLFGVVQDTMDYLQDFANHQECSIEWNPLTNQVTEAIINGDEKLIHQLLNLLFTWTVRATRNNLSLNLTTDLTDQYIFLDFIIRPLKKIANNSQKDLLDQFTRIWSHHRDRQYGITGMELALAKWILKEHKGALAITESDQNRVVLRAAFPNKKPTTTKLP